ncbi:hypothetical protein [Amycolatopsis sp. WQ 127309]|nr:hypothetical protein [Amycolatopsis sp. WQ 127309]UOZ12066.1 hypothetical protein MUY22_20325 [Amycolatopsis sp. WQ 127309]
MRVVEVALDVVEHAGTQRVGDLVDADVLGERAGQQAEPGVAEPARGAA